jgi:hypothetical protein
MNDERSQTLTLLVAELNAIEQWDAEYRLIALPDVDDVIAYVNRRARHGKIIGKIATLMKDLLRPQPELDTYREVRGRPRKRRS